MNKLKSLSLLLVLPLASSAFAASGPSIKETIDFLNKVYNNEDDTYSSPWKSEDPDTLDSKPYFTNGNGKNDCQLNIRVYDFFYELGTLEKVYRNDYFVDMTITHAKKVNDRYALLKDTSGFPRVEITSHRTSQSLPDAIHSDDYSRTCSSSNDCILHNLSSKILNLNFEPYKSYKQNNIQLMADLHSEVSVNKVKRALDHLHKTCKAKYPEEPDPF